MIGIDLGRGMVILGGLSNNIIAGGVDGLNGGEGSCMTTSY